jgi:hypothetical protein
VVDGRCILCRNHEFNDGFVQGLMVRVCQDDLDLVRSSGKTTYDHCSMMFWSASSGMQVLAEPIGRDHVLHRDPVSKVMITSCVVKMRSTEDRAGLGEGLHAGHAELASEARQLEAAEGRLGIVDQFIDHHPSRL